jgi:fluoride ion exporter CrcB/FEX
MSRADEQTVDGLGYSFATWLISLGALHIGFHFAELVPLPIPRHSRASGPHIPTSHTDEKRHPVKARQTPVSDALVILSALLSYLVALLLYFLAPTSWRHRATFSILLAPPGTILRFALSKINTHPRFIDKFPLGTFIANILASIVISAAFVGQRIPSGQGFLRCNALYAIQQGFCGCLSTVSTFVVESRSIKRKRDKWAYVGLSVVLGHLVVLAIVGGVRWDRGLTAVC